MQNPVETKPIEIFRNPQIATATEAARLPLNQATHLPGEYYASEAAYKLEKEQIFLKDWLAVARAEEFPSVGDYRTFNIVGEPFIIARAEDGELKAYINRCAHRGVAVANGQGNTNEFECPYHGWLYGLDGKLMGAPYMDKAEGWDKNSCRLKPVHLAVWQNWVFVNLSHDPENFDEFIAPYDAEFGFLRQDTLLLADKLVLEVDCNWKFPVENLMDNYHSRVLHRKTIGPTMGVERFTGTGRESKAFTAYYPARPMTKKGETLFGIMPSIQRREGINEHFAISAHIAPWMHLFARCDNVHPIIMEPLGVKKVRITCYQLFPKEWHDQSGFMDKVKEYNDFTLAVLTEDASVMESLHDAASSGRYEPGRMSRLELGVWNLINYNADRVLGVGTTQLYGKPE
jgi:phenylpropionate dioxygenase-like ring-hydroxylating dioxygenase large terminal subunit